jgi:hypothetical protein
MSKACDEAYDCVMRCACVKSRVCVVQKRENGDVLLVLANDSVPKILEPLQSFVMPHERPFHDTDGQK